LIEKFSKDKKTDKQRSALRWSAGIDLKSVVPKNTLKCGP
jgi:hypothetical protein